ncbi:MAG: GNAT family N-acetyltransferase, partial [Sphingomonadales bacterium]|nr:GNAT family N-acetyltransferase [Sphingomonadales bacterium]
MDWRLRRAESADAAACSLIAGATFLEAFAGILDGADIVAHVADKSSPANFAVWANDPASVVTLAEATAGAAPVGYSLLTTPDLPVPAEDGDIELKRIYALAPTHGGGLGSALMQRAIEDAQALGRKRMLLGVYGGNARAQRFYAKQGFALVGNRRFKV